MLSVVAELRSQREESEKRERAMKELRERERQEEFERERERRIKELEAVRQREDKQQTLTLNKSDPESTESGPETGAPRKISAEQSKEGKDQKQESDERQQMEREDRREEPQDEGMTNVGKTEHQVDGFGGAQAPSPSTEIVEPSGKGLGEVTLPDASIVHPRPEQESSLPLLSAVNSPVNEDDSTRNNIAPNDPTEHEKSLTGKATAAATTAKKKKQKKKGEEEVAYEWQEKKKKKGGACLLL
jgi:hypothetical protein